MVGSRECGWPPPVTVCGGGGWADSLGLSTQTAGLGHLPATTRPPRRVQPEATQPNRNP